MPSSTEETTTNRSSGGLGQFECHVIVYDPATPLPGIRLRKLTAFVHIKPCMQSSVSNWKPPTYPPTINEKKKNKESGEKYHAAEEIRQMFLHGSHQNQKSTYSDHTYGIRNV